MQQKEKTSSEGLNQGQGAEITCQLQQLRRRICYYILIVMVMATTFTSVQGTLGIPEAKAADLCSFSLGNGKSLKFEGKGGGLILPITDRGRKVPSGSVICIEDDNGNMIDRSQVVQDNIITNGSEGELLVTVEGPIDPKISRAAKPHHKFRINLHPGTRLKLQPDIALSYIDKGSSRWTTLSRMMVQRNGRPKYIIGYDQAGQ